MNYKIRHISNSLKVFALAITTLVFANCSSQMISQPTKVNAEKSSDISTKSKEHKSLKYIHEADFRNFTFPRTKTINGNGDSFTLSDGRLSEDDGRKLVLEAVKFGNSDSMALVTVGIIDGNATHHILYIYQLDDKGKLRLIQQFEFNDYKQQFASAYVAHNELIIETYNIVSGDGLCCPSVIERQHFSQKEDSKFILISSQKISNDYSAKRAMK